MTSTTPTRLAARRLRMSLEYPVETPDAIGGAAIAFAPIMTLWARLEARAGRERTVGDRPEGVAETRITIRWRAGVDTRMRFVAGTRVFAISAVFDPDGRKRDLVCLCQEISP